MTKPYPKKRKEVIREPIESKTPYKHQLDDDYNYDQGEGNYNPDNNQKDYIDTGDEGIGGEEVVDNSNIENDPRKVSRGKKDLYEEYYDPEEH